MGLLLTINLMMCPSANIVLDGTLSTREAKLVLEAERQCKKRYAKSPCLKEIRISRNKDGSTSTQVICGAPITGE